MASLYELVNRLAVLLAARRPTWVIQNDYTGLPLSDSDGVALNDAPRTMVHVALRSSIARPSSLISVTAADLATSFGITVGGNAIVPVPDEPTIEATRDELIVNLQGEPAILALVDVIVGPTAGTIILRSKTETSVATTVSATGGTGAINVVDDATAASIRIYGLPRGAPGWALLRDGDFGAINTSGFFERFDTAGIERLYVELYDVTGNLITVSVGPAMNEV